MVGFASLHPPYNVRPSAVLVVSHRHIGLQFRVITSPGDSLTLPTLRFRLAARRVRSETEPAGLESGHHPAFTFSHHSSTCFSAFSLNIRRPPRSPVTRLEFCEPAASGVEQENNAREDQVNDGKAESPPGWKRTGGCEELREILMHRDGKNNDERVDRVQMEQIEEQGYAPEGDQV